jgi:hypothetical protein
MIYWRKFIRYFSDCTRDVLASFKRETMPVPDGPWQVRASGFASEDVGDLLRNLPTPAMPPQLARDIRLRVAEQRRISQRVTWSWRWGNRLEPFAVPASVGLLSALLIFGIFIRTFEIPVRASSDDVPLQIHTPPRLRTTALLETDTGIECMKVQLLIDETGRVVDFSVLKGNQSPQQIRQLQYLLVFTVFDPATMFGRPTSDTVTLALRDGHVKGVSL